MQFPTLPFVKDVPCYTGVGSREAPNYICDLMTELGTFLCDRGYRLRSGGADKSDESFYNGAIKSARFNEIGAEIYLPFNGFTVREGRVKLYQNLSQGLMDASRFPNIEQAREIGLAARGGPYGLGRGGIALHSRNPYQVLGMDLQSFSRFVFFWAKPVGNAGKVSGGTNTAVQIALARNIPVCNLYTPEGLTFAENFLRGRTTKFNGEDWL